MRSPFVTDLSGLRETEAGLVQSGSSDDRETCPDVRRSSNAQLRAVTLPKPTGRPRRITSDDVATAAGVSRATVSYVMNNVRVGSISEETRQRVLEAVVDLGYTPFGPARALVSGRSDIVLYVLPSWPVGFVIQHTLDVMEAELTPEGLGLVLHRLSRRGERVADAWKAISPFAVIGHESFTDEEARVMRSAGIEVVLVSLDDQRSADHVVLPQSHVGLAQVRHLANAGHTRLGYAFPDDDSLSVFSERRLAGVRQACGERGLLPPDVRTVPLDLKGAMQAVAGWLAAAEPVTAICAYNDDVAIAVLAALQRLDIRVPEDLAVIGCDNDPAGELAYPSLTTVDYGSVESAALVAAYVAARHRGEDVPLPVGEAAVRVVVRESA